MSEWYKEYNPFRRKDPVEQCREWTRSLRKEQRGLDRQIREIEREENKIKRQIKQLAKKNELSAVRSLAKELVASKKAKQRILEAKTHMNSIILQLRLQVSTLRVSQTMKTSTDVMKSMNKLIRLPQMQKDMMEMAVEMEKAGLIQEMVDETLDGVFDEDIDEEIDQEVDKVVLELTTGILNAVDVTPSHTPQNKIAENGKQLFKESLERVAVGADDDDLPPAPSAATSSVAPPDDADSGGEGANDASLGSLEARLEALRRG